MDTFVEALTWGMGLTLGSMFAFLLAAIVAFFAGFAEEDD